MEVLHTQVEHFEVLHTPLEKVCLSSGGGDVVGNSGGGAAADAAAGVVVVDLAVDELDDRGFAVVADGDGGGVGTGGGVVWEFFSPVCCPFFDFLPGFVQMILACEDFVLLRGRCVTLLKVVVVLLLMGVVVWSTSFSVLDEDVVNLVLESEVVLTCSMASTPREKGGNWYFKLPTLTFIYQGHHNHPTPKAISLICKMPEGFSSIFLERSVVG